MHTNTPVENQQTAILRISVQTKLSAVHVLLGLPRPLHVEFLAVRFPAVRQARQWCFLEWNFVSKPLLDEALVPVVLNYHIAPSRAR